MKLFGSISEGETSSSVGCKLCSVLHKIASHPDYFVLAVDFPNPFAEAYLLRKTVCICTVA